MEDASETLLVPEGHIVVGETKTLTWSSLHAEPTLCLGQVTLSMRELQLIMQDVRFYRKQTLVPLLLTHGITNVLTDMIIEYVGCIN